MYKNNPQYENLIYGMKMQIHRVVSEYHKLEEIHLI